MCVQWIGKEEKIGSKGQGTHPTQIAASGTRPKRIMKEKKHVYRNI